MKTNHVNMENIIALVLLCLLLFHLLITALTRSPLSIPQKQTYTPKHRNFPSTLEKSKQYTNGSFYHPTPPRETHLWHHEHNQRDGGVTAFTTRSSATYWVDAGANGDGTSEANSAGNITYVLKNLVTASTYDTIKVKPGVYNHTIESSPLHVDTAHVTLTSTAGASATVINGTGETDDIKVTASNITINGFTIINTEIGIYLGASTNNTITNNIITDNTLDGIHLFQSSNTTVADNIIINNSREGISLGHSSKNTIESNTITKTRRGIFLHTSSNTTVAGNTITTNGHGINLFISSNTTITKNTITTNGRGIYLEASSTGNLVYRNNFIGNDVHAKDLDGGNAFNTSTTGNYWDDYNGTDVNGDGIGDTSYAIPRPAGSEDYHPVMTPFELPPPLEEPRQQDPLRFVIPVVVLAAGLFLGVLLVRHGGDLVRLPSFIPHTRLKTLFTTMTAYLQRFRKEHYCEAPSVQNVLEVTVDMLGTRFEGSVREEDKPDLLNLVRKAFSLLGKRFGVTWKDVWTVREYMSALIDRAGPTYASLLREGYHHFEEILYAEHAEWRDALQAIHHILVTITDKLGETPSSPTER
ncbi:MAG: hypothetical protein GWO20_08590 [Candidatus Korarchaeota archaeon]|nr:hypothetical protein [Candidatus Korarchaeota archaeon]NIU83445.1 hypothetical protein [Candidatus Thorarchaeota archaeon]NIW13721.1 hypothetical protein [Candidatus Thorarchaeota archaeon]NIW51816.1 hypothetical protein [Candidatus Korarchaeota archaeon]